MVKFGKTEIGEKTFYAAKNTMKIWHVNFDIFISKLVKTKTNSKYLIGYSDKDIRPIVLIMPKMGGYVFGIDDKKLFEKYKVIWTKSTELNALPVYDDRYIKTKMIIYGDKVYTNVCGLNVPEDDAECESFTVISIDSLLVSENKYYLDVYLDIFANKIVNKQMTDYLDKNLFED